MASKTIIFGSSGYIGKNIANNLSISGQDIIKIASRDIDLLCRDSKHKVSALPLEDSNIIIASAITRSKKDDLDSFRRNVIMLANLVEGLRGRQMRSILYLSAADVYGLPSLRLKESDTHAPNNFYGNFKSIAESILRLSFSNELLTIFRLPGVFGGINDEASIISRFTHSIWEKKELTLTNCGETKRDFLPMPFLQDAIGSHLNSPVPNIYNVSSNSELMLKDIVKLIGHCLAKETSHNFVSIHSARDFNLSFDCSLLLNTYPALVKPSLEKSIQLFVKKFINNRI